MVSFSCENCGDVVTKKKLDAHRNYCHGASFTCLDCMVHFHGTAYRDHTSCISEAQKYEGKLYKDKPKRKSVTIAIPGEETPLQPYVEDVPDEPGSALTRIEAMPQAPSPPPSAPPTQTHPAAVNVFDFLVDDATPNASRVALGPSAEQMCMVDHAPPLFNTSLSSSPDGDFHHQGFAYGATPIESQSYDTFRTPANKPAARRGHAHSSSTDKKRKRQIEELDLSRASRSSAELDDEMPDAAGMGYPVLHSGLTGGLHRMLTAHAHFPPSPEISGDAGPDAEQRSPLSPAKRKRAPASSVAASTATDKRGRRLRPAHGQLIKVRKARRTSDEHSRPRKHHRGTRERSDGTPSKDSPPRATRAPGPGPKAIEYLPRHDESPTGRADNQMVVYTSRAEMFLSFVSKGPDSEHGYSINKALKRYHRERGASGGAGRDGKAEAEKELWKGLRLKRNERGEVVVFLG